MAVPVAAAAGMAAVRQDGLAAAVVQLGSIPPTALRHGKAAMRPMPENTH